MPELYRFLDQDARRWWHHRELREQKQAAEARRRERQSIRERLRVIRAGVLLSIGEGGWTLHYDPGRPYASARLEGYDTNWAAVLRVILRRVRPDLPSVDLRGARHLARLAIRGPLPAVSREPDAPMEDGAWHGFSFCPLPIYLALAELAGADVFWGRYADQREAALAKAEPTARRMGIPVGRLAVSAALQGADAR